MIVGPFRRILESSSKLLKANFCVKTENIIDELKSSYDSLTLDDFAKTLRSLSCFDDVDKTNVADFITHFESTSRFDELVASPVHAASILQSALTLEICPEKLINSVIQEDFIIKFPDDQWQLKALLAVKDTLAIEYHDKYGERIRQLDELIKAKKSFKRWSMEQLLPMKPIDQSYSQKLSVLIYLACREYYPKQTISRHILSFCVSPEIIICNTRFNPIMTDKEIEVAPNVIKDATIIRRFKDNNNKEFISDLKLRNRLLEKMGFKIFTTEPLRINRKSTFNYFRKSLPIKVDG
ncbi:uncharacterized protein LOC107367909 [Tetranychus urticae]|uniref:Uncharacterized protein n=1 Tax=Tetranychus urticae TaxID=32264 RepID=T1KWD0_TETUR|nr:uncharacterized protein LOC107367909 [Tetranychus urticae]